MGGAGECGVGGFISMPCAILIAFIAQKRKKNEFHCNLFLLSTRLDVPRAAYQCNQDCEANAFALNVFHCRRSTVSNPHALPLLSQGQ